ncbi:MAG TPA: NaeI family type II restriction endonuclease [Verrucomicrobiae bacterium]|nr:NaeI family type II restriction endonuclease [Verrucomicrobiae bacterium]
MLTQPDMDAELEAVKAAILTLDPQGNRTAQVLRDTFDQLYDGQRTGRYRVDQLHKTEKTHCGTLVEINLHREFGFEDGKDMDYRIAGVDVDCKYSQIKGGWMIPPEAHGHLCLLVWANDSKDPKWSVGLVRVTLGRLNSGGNRDQKATLNGSGRNAIVWLFKDAHLPPNVLLQLDRDVVDRILGQTSGQKKVNELFRNTLGMKVGRAVVATVAQQDDYMKRVRGNGGARTALQPEGIIILGQFHAHGIIAKALGVPVPEHGESVSVKITPASGIGAGVARIGGRFWRIAKSTDPITLAPSLPKI